MTELNVLVTLGLTLPRLEAADRDRIVEAAGGTLTVVDRWQDGLKSGAGAEVMLGIVPPKLFAAAGRLKWVHATTSGVDMFMYQQFIESKVVLTGEKGLVGPHLADHAFGLLLALTRRIAEAVRLGPEAWAHRESMRKVELELEGLHMGIIGFGGTGRAMARRAAAFGMTCSAIDVHPVAGSAEVAKVQSLDDLDQLLRDCDVVAVCCPLTRQTENLFDEAAFGKMRQTAVLINVTRGQIVEQHALVRALQTGRIAGAALDVVPGEPLPAKHPLFRCPNLVMTPHTAGASQHRARRNLDRFIRNIGLYKAGEPLEGLVDKHLGY